MRTKEIIEAVLFSAGEPVGLPELAELLEIDEIEALKEIKALTDEYESAARGVRIIELNDSFQMCSRADYYPYIKKIAEPRRQTALSGAALEVLSIIAYNQPVTKVYIEQIRGVDCAGPLTRLLERGLADEAGRLDAPGRPLLYVTTDEFLRCFGLRSLDELPEVEDLEIKNFEF